MGFFMTWMDGLVEFSLAALDIAQILFRRNWPFGHEISPHKKVENEPDGERSLERNFSAKSRRANCSARLEWTVIWRAEKILNHRRNFFRHRIASMASVIG